MSVSNSPESSPYAPNAESHVAESHVQDGGLEGEVPELAAPAGFLQATLDSLSSHIAILDEEGNIIAVNAAWKRFAQENDYRGSIFGLGTNYLAVCAQATGADAEEAPEVLAGLQDVLTGRRDEFYLEYPCHSPDEQRWFSLRATRFWGADESGTNENGAPARVVVTHENITQRKQAELRLRQETEIVETLYHVGQVVAAELDASTVIATVTKAAVELTGAQYGLFLPTKLLTIGGPSAYSLEDDVSALAHSAAALSFETLMPPSRTSLSSVTMQMPEWKAGKMRHPFGELEIKSYLGEAVVSRAGERLGALFLGHFEAGAFSHAQTRILGGLASQAGLSLEHARLYDMQLKEKEAAAASERRYRLVSELIPQIVWMTGRHGYHEFFNQRWYDYTGQSEEISLGVGWMTPLHPDDVERSRRRWQHSLETGEPYEIEYRFQRYDGIYRWFLGRALPLRDENGTIVKWLGSCTDIDDAKRAEAERFASLEREAAARRDAEAANRIKDEFLAVVSHELRTPLTPILGWMEILRSDDPDGPLRMQAYDVIERNARAQSQIINDLLDISRIITGKLKLDIRPIDIVRVVESAIETVETAARAKGVVLRYDLDTDLGATAGDDDRLRQVVWNLVSNAVKFTPRGGRVTVRLRRDDSAFILDVSDTGPGIAPEFLPYVFERFRQADGSSTRKHGGLGLGLSIVKYLVEQHGGTASVESEGMGRGATFRVRLPVAPILPNDNEETGEGIAQTLPAFQASRDMLKDLRVLVVDDELDAREMLRAVLTRHGADVQTAGSAQEALLTLDEFLPDVLVSDIGMPGIDGYSLIQMVRKRPDSRGGKVPALALTAYARAQDRAMALSSGFQNHLAKPVSPAELVVTLGALVGRIENTKRADESNFEA